MLQDAGGYTAPAIPGSHWIPPIFGTAVFLYGGWVFIQGAMRELRDHLPGMMTLIALAISVAFVFSVVVTLGYPGMTITASDSEWNVKYSSSRINAKTTGTSSFSRSRARTWNSYWPVQSSR